MAKQVMIQPWDDLDLKEGRKVPAAAEDVPLSFDGVAVELDLSQVNLARLSEFLEPFLAAGRKPGRAENLIPAHSTRSSTSQRYFENMRRFADERGYEYHKTAKGWSYSQRLRRDYAEHVKHLGGTFLDSKDPVPEAPEPDPPPASEIPQEGTEAYYDGMRQFADAHGIKYEFPSGRAYSPKLHARYRAFLHGQPEPELQSA